MDMRPSKVVIFNNTADTLNFAMLERRAANFTKWQPCSHPGLCGDQGIKPGRSKGVIYERIHGWYPGAEVVVYWWRLVPDEAAQDGYRVDGPHEQVVRTPKKATLVY